MLCKCGKCWWVYPARMSPTINRSSMLECFEQSNRVMFDFYLGLPHIHIYQHIHTPHDPSPLLHTPTHLSLLHTHTQPYYTHTHTHKHAHTTTHLPTHTHAFHPHPHTHTHTYHHPPTHTRAFHPPTHTHTHTHTHIPVSWGDGLCSCCFLVDSLSYSIQNTTLLSHCLNCLL